MLDEDSIRFLVCKKIAQLVKLINHLNTQIADTQNEVDCTTAQFEKAINLLLKNHINSLNDANDLLKQIGEESENSYKTKYKEKYDQIYSEYEKILVSCQSDLTELTISISHDLSKITSYINSVDSDLETYLKQLDQIIEHSKSQYTGQIEKINKSYKEEILLLDDESKEKLNILQEQTSKKLDMLDRDFNRSLNDLKAKFGQINSSNSIKIENEENFKKIQNDHNELKKNITATKDEAAFFISNTKAVLREQINKKKKISEELKRMIENQNNELKEAKDSIELNLKNINEEYEKAKNDFENRQKEMTENLEDLQKKFLNLTKSDLEEIQEQQLLFRLSSRKSSESMTTMLNDIAQQIQEKKELIDKNKNSKENLFNQLNKDTQNLLNQIQEKNEELSKIKEVHESERLILSKSQKSAIDDLKSIHQKEIEKLREKINKKFENTEINKKIEENRNIFNSLCFEKAQLLNKNDDDEDPEISELKEKYEMELKNLENELLDEYESICNEEKILIEACSESHRNEMFETNTSIAQKYDKHLQSIRESFNKRDFKAEDEKINKDYENQLNQLENQYEQIQNDNKFIPKHEKVDDRSDEIDSLTKEKNDKKDKIENEKNLIINEFLKQQKIEEDDYLRRMAEINYNSNILQNNHSNEYEKIRNQYHFQIQKMNIRIKELETELDSLRNKILDVEKISSDFDINEKKLRDSLNELRAKSDIKISKTIYKADVKKSDVLKKIENFQKKFNRISSLAKQHTEQASIMLKDAEEKAQEESKNLQQRVAHAISKLIKHFTKEKDKKNKKFTSKSEELKKLINDQKSEIDAFTNESTQKENELKTNYENEIQSNESNSKKELDNLHAENDKKAQELDDKYDEILTKIEQFKLDIINQKSRDEELLIIERLERQLSIKDQHIKDINDDISDCKSKIISQEVVYNSHFGIQPSVAVFRPTTAVVPIPINLRLKQQQRPVSAATKMRPMSSLLKNKSKKNDVS